MVRGQQVAPPPSSWGLAQLRLTVFANRPAHCTAEMFERFFGFAPENESIRRAEFLTELSAARGTALYQAITAGPKIDMVASAVLGPGLPTAIPVLPHPQQITEAFQATASDLIASIGSA